MLKATYKLENMADKKFVFSFLLFIQALSVFLFIYSRLLNFDLTHLTSSQDKPNHVDCETFSARFSIIFVVVWIKWQNSLQTTKGS